MSGRVWDDRNQSFKVRAEKDKRGGGSSWGEHQVQDEFLWVFNWPLGSRQVVFPPPPPEGLESPGAMAGSFQWGKVFELRRGAAKKPHGCTFATFALLWRHLEVDDWDNLST